MYHSLEISILDAAFAKPIDTQTIEANLSLMLQQEIYLTIRSGDGFTVGDVIFRLVGFPLLREPLGSHNAKIDDIKRRRLSSFLEKICADIAELRENEKELRAHQQLHPQDLTFLLTEAILRNSPCANIQFLIDIGADCNGFGTLSRKPLHLAVEKNNEPVVDILCEQGAIPTEGDAEHKNVLHTALSQSRLPLLAKLVNVYQCDVNVLDYNGNSLLHSAVLFPNRRQAFFLLELGVNPTITNIYKETPLEVAIAGTKGFDILNSMFISDFPPNQPNKQDIRATRQLIASDLRAAIAERERIGRIIQSITHPQDGYLHFPSQDITDKDIPLLIAALRKAPFFHTINLNYNKLTPVGITKLMEYLVPETWVVEISLAGCPIAPHLVEEYKQTLHPNNRLIKLLDTYTSEEPLDVASMLIEKSADFAHVHADGWHLWHCATHYGHIRIIRELLTHQIDISGTTSDEYDQRNCVHLAIGQNQVETLKTLLESGQFYIDTKNGTGKTGLMISFDKQSLDCMRLCLEHGANPQESFQGQVLLDLTIEHYHAAIPLLMQYGAKLTDKARAILADPLQIQERVPLFSIFNEWRQKEIQLCDAVQQNSLDLVKRLVQEGVDVTCADNRGNSPFKIAIESKHWEIATFLIYIDANLLNTFRKLTVEEEECLNQYFQQYQKRDADAIIYFLRSRTSYCESRQAGNKHNIMDIYRDLFGTEGDIFCQFTRPLLLALEHLPNLSIVYDPSAADTKRANILSEEGTRGSFSRANHTIHIAGRPAENYAFVRGTMIHEICHGVCYLVWNHECEPFAPGTPEEAQFEGIYQQLCIEYEDRKTRTTLDTIVQEVFSYSPNKHKRELIVRVPQIIATHGIEHAEKLCQKSLGFRQLFDYYVTVVLPAVGLYIEKTHSAKQVENPAKSTDPDRAVSQACKIMLIASPSYMMQNDAALKIQAYYKMCLEKRTFHYLVAAQQFCDILIGLLERLQISEATIPIREKIDQKRTFILDNRNSLFSRYQVSKELITTFQDKTNEMLNALPKLK